MRHAACRNTAEESKRNLFDGAGRPRDQKKNHRDNLRKRMKPLPVPLRVLAQARWRERASVPMQVRVQRQMRARARLSARNPAGLQQ